jgi:protein gp37
MSDGSKIEWTDATWNPVRGCTKISPGCAHCYAETFAERFRGVPGHPYQQGFDLKLVPEKLDEPLKWRKPRLVFVNSMSDLFHERVPTNFVRKVFATMVKAEWHQFQLLTKRPERASKLASRLPWPSNVWLGVSVESQRYTHRIDVLREIPAEKRFLSLEPLLGPLRRLNLDSIHWVIVGGESGPRARPMEEAWVLDIRAQCQSADVPFFFKQWGSYGPDGKRRSKKENGRLLEGRTWDEWPNRTGVSG